MTATTTDTVTLDRATFEEVITRLAGIAGFAARAYGGAGGPNECGFVWDKVLTLRLDLLSAAGYPELPGFDFRVFELDESGAEGERATLVEHALFEEWVDNLRYPTEYAREKAREAGRLPS